MSLLQIQEQCLNDSVDWFGEEVASDLKHHILGMVGELGEFTELVKKIDRGSLDFEEGGEVHMMLGLELVDLFIYVCNAAALLRVDLEGNYKVKRQFNQERFGAEASEAQEGQGLDDTSEGP